MPKALNTIHSTTTISRQNWKKNKNTIQICEMLKLRPFKPLFDILKIVLKNYGPSITHKDEHFAKKKCIKIG